MNSRGILPTIFKISEEEINAVMKAYRTYTETTDATLRPLAVNSLMRYSVDEVIRKIKESPAIL